MYKDKNKGGRQNTYIFLRKNNDKKWTGRNINILEF